MDALVEGGDVVKVDMLIQRELQRGGYVIRMIVFITTMMVMMLIVTMGHAEQ